MECSNSGVSPNGLRNLFSQAADPGTGSVYMKKKYSNGVITVLWEPDKCIHSAICFRGLPQVFDPRKRPWVDISGAEDERIIDQVNKCPSGALSIISLKKD